MALFWNFGIIDYSIIVEISNKVWTLLKTLTSKRITIWWLKKLE